MLIVDHDEGELVAAQARHECAFHQRIHAMRKLTQQCIANSVAIDVVDLPEAVQVDADDRKMLFCIGIGDRRRQPLVEESPIGKIGQHIVVGHVAIRRSFSDFSVTSSKRLIKNCGEFVLAANHTLVDLTRRISPCGPGTECSLDRTGDCDRNASLSRSTMMSARSLGRPHARPCRSSARAKRRKTFPRLD